MMTAAQIRQSFLDFFHEKQPTMNGCVLKLFLAAGENELMPDGGEKEIAADKVLKQLTDNYVLVNKLEVSFSGLNEDQITEKKNQLAGYEASLKDKSKTFEEIYVSSSEIFIKDTEVDIERK